MGPDIEEHDCWSLAYLNVLSVGSCFHDFSKGNEVDVD